jgi:hypothetical protein
MSNSLLRAMCLIFLGFGLAIATACASVNSDYYYEFEFQLREDGQTAEVLDYRVESQGRVVLRADAAFAPFMDSGTWINGPRPTLIHIRWKDIPSDQEYQRDIDVSATLAAEDMDSKTIYLMFDRARVSIYLISEDLRPADERLVGPQYASYRSRKLIYSK